MCTWPSEAAATGAGEMLAKTWLAGLPQAASMLASACASHYMHYHASHYNQSAEPVTVGTALCM